MENALAYVTWSLDALTRFCNDVFVNFGFSEDESAQISDVLLTADLYGIESHGMQRMVRYHKGIEKGQIHLDAKPEVVFETPVSALLGETVTESKADDLKAISEKLEVINLQLAQRKESRRKAWHWFFIALCAVIVIIFIVTALIDNIWLKWDYSDPETTVMGTMIHAFAWAFFRVAPFALTGTVIGIVLTRKKR